MPDPYQSQMSLPDHNGLNFTGGSMSSQSNLAHLRLDTEALLQRIELFLRGREVQIVSDPDGTIREEVMSVGDPKMNDAGVQSIMWRVSSVITPQVVQGNISREEHKIIVCDFQIDFAVNLSTNLHHWDVSINDYDVIIDTIMPQVQLFLSRLIDNKERESYVPTMQHIERYTPDKQQSTGIMGALRGGLGGFGGGGQ